MGSLTKHANLTGSREIGHQIQGTPENLFNPQTKPVKRTKIEFIRGNISGKYCRDCAAVMQRLFHAVEQWRSREITSAQPLHNLQYFLE